jgi:hypothetical protein
MNHMTAQEVNLAAQEEQGQILCQETEQRGCGAVGYQDVNVCIPVTIKPFGEVGNAKTHCLGNAVVSGGCTQCPGQTGGVCKFTISQKLRVEVPVVFGARAEVGEVLVDCGCAESTGGCNGV